jgi:hypothetical protein
MPGIVVKFPKKNVSVEVAIATTWEIKPVRLGSYFGLNLTLIIKTKELILENSAVSVPIT